jgi:hypothetical protein
MRRWRPACSRRADTGIGNALFWGEDATDFAQACLDTPALLRDPELLRLDALPLAATRVG